ncbi:hypothetical protein O6H91_03G019900 [Diphasiastrum complanatum]|nr:hypothetical protein O6H91_03G019900 [Diphasiastrum complanatum]
MASSLVICQNTSFSFTAFHAVDQIVTISDANVTAQGSIVFNRYGFVHSTETSGRALYGKKVQLRDSSNRFVASFNASFTFSIDTLKNNAGAHGMAFIVVPDNTLVGDPDKYLGVLTASNNNQPRNHVFAVEIDNWMDKEFDDPSYSHIGVNINSMNSSHTLNLCASNDTGCRYFVNSGNFTLSISYDGVGKTLLVSLGSNEAGSPSLDPISGLDLFDIFQDYMYVGFSGATGGYIETHTIYSWSFSSIMPGSPLSPTPKTQSRIKHHSSVGALIAIVVCVFVVVLLVGGLIVCMRRRKRITKGYESEEDRKLDGLYEQFQISARRFTYNELRVATKDFSPEEELGRGAFGIVYRGTLPDTGSLVAVKQIKENSRQGEREFLAELSIISRVRHRNLVHLRGWCHAKDKLILVYDFMPNGSLEKLLRSEGTVLPWEIRHRIVTGVAAALAYLHEEWEECIIHRDVKSSNVLLDANYAAHLGDFGLARLMDHNKTAQTTVAAGTFGYLAPEIAHTGKATTSSDVYSFGILALEVASGRRPLDWNLTETEMVLQDTVWNAHQQNNLLKIVDPKLGGEFDVDQMACLLRVGLLCSHPDPSARPTMRLVRQVLSGDASLPALPVRQPEMHYSLHGGHSPGGRHTDTSD